MPKPNCWFNPTGYGTLGYAFPAALGAKFAAPERNVAVLVGDAGFQYTLQELGTAVEHKLPLAIILWNNGGLGEIERSMQAVNIQPTQVKPHNPDFQALAKAYGADAVLADSKELFIKSVRGSQTKDRPTLIEVRQGSSWLL
jgi:5-guanidino-2-oxopentanoate decarboxylase